MQKNKIIPLAAAISFACAGAAHAQELVKIGQVGPTTGPISHLGKDLQNGARMAIDELNAKGASIGGKSAKGAGVKVVATQFTTDKATDFNAILTAIKAKKPDLVFFGGMDAVAGPMLRQMKQIGIHLPFMGGDGICSEGLAALAGEAMADGQVVCAEAGGVEESGRKGLDDFKAAYRKKYGIDVQSYSPYAYDAVMTMAGAMAKAGSWQPDKYLPELAKIRHKGITGEIAFDARGDMQQGTLTLYTYKQGKRQLLVVTK